MTASTDPVRQVSVGESQYHKKNIQPWDIWEEYALNPWDADIIKRVLRNKPGQAILDYEKIKHLCDERIRQLRCESALETQGKGVVNPFPASREDPFGQRGEIFEDLVSGRITCTEASERLTNSGFEPLVKSDGRAEYLEKMRADVREAYREPEMKPRNTFANKGAAT